jgi:hypothetical protein
MNEESVTIIIFLPLLLMQKINDIVFLLLDFLTPLMVAYQLIFHLLTMRINSIVDRAAKNVCIWLINTFTKKIHLQSETFTAKSCLQCIDLR